MTKRQEISYDLQYKLNKIAAQFRNDTSYIDVNTTFGNIRITLGWLMDTYQKLIDDDFDANYITATMKICNGAWKQIHDKG